MDEFQELMERVKSLTGLGARDAAQVAYAFDDGEQPAPQEIVDKAIELGFDVARKHGQTKTSTIGAEMTMDPAEVLTEVYMACPRVMMSQTPKMGRAPAEAQEHFPELMASLPDEIKVLLVKIDMLEGAATFWIHDEANDVDRPIGPIDITRYDSERALEEAFMTLLQRIGKVLTADLN